MLSKSKSNGTIKHQDSLIKQLETNSEKDAAARAAYINKWEGIRDNFSKSGSTRSHPIYTRRPA
jgi:hypothetical protein